jgi:hypothetical protein
VGNHAISL